MTIFISNAFSLNMTGDLFAATRPLSIQEVLHSCVDFQYSKSSSDDEGEHTGGARARLKAQSIVGHDDIARLIGGELGCHIPVNRVTVALQDGDVLFVGQYVGPRLEAGTTVLPANAEIRWFRVDVQAEDPVAQQRRRDFEDLIQRGKRRDELFAAFGLDREVVGQLQLDEDVQNCGWPSDDRRDELAEEVGLTREQLDALIS